MQWSRVAFEVVLWKRWGALAGMLMVSPAFTVDFLPRNVASVSPSRRIKVSSKSWRCGGGPTPIPLSVSDLKISQLSRIDLGHLRTGENRPPDCPFFYYS